MSLSFNQLAAPTVEPLAIDMNGLRHIIGDPSLSTVTAWRLEKRGLIQRVPGLRRRLYTIESVRAYISGNASVRALAGNIPGK